LIVDKAVFKVAWEESGDQLCRYTASAVAAHTIPDSAKDFLTTVGLPVEAAPFLTFDPNVSDRLAPCEEQSPFVLGLDGSGNPIVLDSQGVVWLVDHDGPSCSSLINSSIPALAECLVAYRAMVANAIIIGGDEAYLKGRVPKHLIAAFSETVNAIDPDAIKPKTFWGEEVSMLISESA
jgi:hypothetical protein